MNKFPDSVVKYLLENVRRDGDHRFWDGSRNRFKFRGVHYRAHHVLWGDTPKPGKHLVRTCDQPGCIARVHMKIESSGRPGVPLRPDKRKQQKYTHCSMCKSALRPQGTPKALRPNTKSHSWGGLCQSCRATPHNAYARPSFGSTRTQQMWSNLIPDGATFDFDPGIVYRNVPRDLHHMFGVANP